MMDDMGRKDIVFSGHQPNFLPYMGVFYKMYRSDVFVLDDDVQYSTNGLHNANFIKVNGAKHRITVPVSYRYGERINEVRICYATDWRNKMLKTLQMNYGKALFFNEGFELIEKHIGYGYEKLFDLNYALISEITQRFGFKCRIVVASIEVPTMLKNNQRNIFQCLALGGNTYYSGTGGKAYNDETEYNANGIELVYSDYQPVIYKQIGKKFIENLSVLDYIFNKGYSIPDQWEHEPDSD